MGRSTTIHISIDVPMCVCVCVCIYKIRKIFALNLKGKALYCLDRAGSVYRRTYIWKGLGQSAFPLRETLKQQHKVEMRAATSTARYYNPVNVTNQATRQPDRGRVQRTTSPSIHKPANTTQHKNNKKRRNIRKPASEAKRGAC